MSDNGLPTKKNVYQFWFRRGNAKPEFVIFPFDGNLQDAINKCMKVSDEAGLRFCGVYPCLVDIDAFAKMNTHVSLTT